MKKTLFLIVGASGAGKDYMVDKLCSELPSMKRVISRTTRKCRGPKDLHVFVDSDTAGKELPYSIARTDYNNNIYYVLPEDIEDADFYIIDPKGVDTIKQEKAKGAPCLEDRNLVTIYLNIHWYIRFRNMIKRGDRLLTIIDRLMVDRVEFRDVDPDDSYRSSNDFYEYFTMWYPRCELSR